MPADAFAAITIGSLREGAAFDCKGLGRAVNAVERRDPPAATRIAEAGAELCPKLAASAASPL